MRWFLAIATQIFYQLSQRRPVLVKRMLRRALERQLPLGYDIDTHFTPHYNPWDQRLCATPDGDFFKALCAGTVSVVTDQITAFTKTGLRLASGAELPADVIVTATGLEMLFMGGIELSLDGKNVDVSRLLVYKGMMLEGIPNLAWAFGYTNASWTLKCELTCAYVCRLLNYMRESGFRQCAPRSRGATISVQPMVSLSSGYVRRALDRFPKQGSRFPWQVHQSYLHDYWELKVRGIEDQTMVFSSPGQNGMVAAA
jgi:cation diffusion facilitator CzcD-associated flavoprotein CzcO